MYIVIQVPRTSTLETGPVWGDEGMALGLLLALQDLGHTVDVHNRHTIRQLSLPPDVCIDLYPSPACSFVPAKRNVWWYQAPHFFEGPPLPSLADIVRMSFWESCYAAPTLGNHLAHWGVERSFFLPMSASPKLWSPRQPSTPRKRIVFVGNMNRSPSEVTSFFAPLVPLGLEVYGSGWEKSDLPASCLKGPIAYSKVADLYSSSDIVLSHHVQWHKHNDVPTSRLFEAALCGCCIVSDYLPTGEALFGDTVVWVKDDERDVLPDIVAGLLADDALRGELGVSACQHVLSDLTFEKHAPRLLDWLAEVDGETARDKRRWMYWNAGCQPGEEVLHAACGW